MSDRQTLSFLSKTLQRAGLHPKTKYGQNFLIDLNLLDILIQGADLGPNDVVLEIGTGMGSLTKTLAARAGWVITVEVDRDLQKIAAKELGSYSNFNLLCCDALRNKNHLRVEVLQAVADAMAKIPGAKFKLVANLPYNVATPIISNLLHETPLVERMVVTIQKELGERIIAEPSCKDYSALSIWMQSQCDCEILRILPPSAFWPRPKVDSAILRIVPNASKRSSIVDLDFFHTRLRAMFLHRRKFLRSQLISAMQELMTKEQVDAVLDQLGLEPNLRAEQLTVQQMISLLESCRVQCSA
ncbi:MAG: 16S rRNA (adenine(1518)-N(6)/adenine(1519)-N(6))-dimethyltransferase RsmA [Pirellula sp.]|jgi:16S rRNA (adenine1518-N6/adenine1519-N6)-dimethyltransferase|nr:ribosomal RNA small subunit methyltransferase A [Planctomycetota bacterium]